MTPIDERIAAILASPRVTSRGPRLDDRDAGSSPAALRDTPEDLARLYAAADGLELDDGTCILARGEVERATAWLVEEKTLHWEEDLLVVGERDDLVLIVDRDARCVRAGGGLLEAATDGLEAFRRVALGIVELLEARLDLAETPPIAPERAARQAIALRDPDALEAAIARGFYPSAERDLAHAGMSLGAMRAASGDRVRAMAAFESAAAARVRAVRRGAEAAERAAAWRASAAAAEAAGAPDIAEACRERSRA